MQVKEPVPKTVVDKNGNKQPLKAGLEPIYIKLHKFGRTPKYLVRFLQIKEKEYQMKKDARGVQQPLCRYITRDERKQLLQVRYNICLFPSIHSTEYTRSNVGFLTTCIDTFLDLGY